MKMIRKIFGFFNPKFLLADNEANEDEPMLEQLNNEIVLEQLANETTQSEEEERINASKKTLITRLYIVEQEISMFKESFPKEYEAFKERIELLRQEYTNTLDELTKTLTFEIDPETDGYKIGKVVKLEKEVKAFLEKEVKFDIISKRIQKLILKLNILYNVSIFHSKEHEKNKVLSRLKQALEVEIEITNQFKECDYIVNDTQLKERMIELLSYADYEILKTTLRNSSFKEQPCNVIKKLVMIQQFDEFDYVTAFKSFMKEELSDFSELLLQISNTECRKVFKQKLDKILEDITYCDNLEAKFLDVNFWNTFLNFEANLLGILNENNIEKEKVKVKLIARMNIGVSENEVLTMPVTNAYLALINLFYISHDERILLVIRLLKNVSKDVTYKEIYFLLLLFDVIEVTKNTPNELIKHIEKYINKYPYNRKEITEKKKSVISSQNNKEYVVVFALDNREQETIKALEKLNIDFKVIDGNVYMNTFYFNALTNVLRTLQTNTKNII